MTVKQIISHLYVCILGAFASCILFVEGLQHASLMLVTIGGIIWASSFGLLLCCIALLSLEENL